MSGSATTQPLQTGQKISVNNNTYVAIQPVPYNTSFSTAGNFLPYATWNALNNYSTTGTTASTSPYVSFDGRLYKALSNNTNQQPDVSPLVWKQLEFSLNNNGIYRVVRSWGDNFWVEIPNAVEELTTLQDPTDLQFFSYDSIMPNDILTVGTPLLGSANVASYTVLDDNGTSSFFPSNFNLYVTPTFAATSYALTASPACNVTAGAVYSGTSTTGTTLLFTITTTGNGLTTITGSSNGLLTPGGTLIKSTGGNAGDTTTIVYTSFAATGSGAVQLNNDYPLITIQDSQVLTSYKRILSIGPDSSALASVIVDSPELIDRFSPTYGAYVQMQNKLNFGTTINYGLDAYKTYQGLTRELVRVIYGDPTSPADYPGVRAAGAYVEPKPAQILRINTISLAIRLNTGISFVDIRDRIKAAVAAYVNSLNVGEAVSLSSVIAAASSIVGVESVSFNSPYYSPTSDRIIVGANEVAKIITPTTDIILTSLTS
jgi:hypothetical protein